MNKAIAKAKQAAQRAKTGLASCVSVVLISAVSLVQPGLAQAAGPMEEIKGWIKSARDVAGDDLAALFAVGLFVTMVLAAWAARWKLAGSALVATLLAAGFGGYINTNVLGIMKQLTSGN